MLYLKRFLQGFAVLALSGTPGCAVYMRPAPPPGAVFIVREPPRMRDEVIVVRPGREYIWVGGYWSWRQSDFIWVPGRWAMPPSRMRAWVPGGWHHERRGWFFIEGHWR